MAKFKRDEARSFGFLWLLTGGLFAVLSAWAMYNEIVVRTPWQAEQKEFFQLELDQATKNLERQKYLAGTVKLPALSAPHIEDVPSGTANEQIAALEAQMTKNTGDVDGKKTDGLKGQDPYASAARELATLNDKYAGAEQNKTFAKSDLDEAYYYRTLAEYERDEAEGKAHAAIERSYDDGRAKADAIFVDPPPPPNASICPDRLKKQDNCADLIHVEGEKLKNQQHADKAQAAAKDYPLAGDDLRAAAKKDEDVAARVDLEIKQQKRLNEALNDMLTIDDQRVVDKGKMKDVDDTVDALTREKAKLQRPILDATLRLTKAIDRANPKFDLANVIGSLVGVYEINQIVTDWNGKMQVDRCSTCHMGIDSANYTDLTIPKKFRTHPQRSALFASHDPAKFGCTSCHSGQGRATEEHAAHSLWKLQDHDGEPRWELDGDEFWEDPMLQIGELNKVTIDARNSTFKAAVGKGQPKAIEIPQQDYLDELQLLGQMQILLQNQMPAQLAADWRARVVKIGNRINIGLEAITPAAEAAEKKPTLTLQFPEPELAELLGFVNQPRIAGNPFSSDGSLKCTPWCVAVNPPSEPVRGGDPAQPDDHFVAPTGKNGLQVPLAYRDRFIQALPETQAACIKCHAEDNDLRPHKSKAQWILSNREKTKTELHRVACKAVLESKCDPTDAACATQHDECTKLTTTEPVELGPDPEKMADLAPVAMEGRNLFKRLNCTGCHILDGFPGNRSAGPQLNAISAKVTPQWILQWIRYPRAWRAKTRMPALWPLPMDPETKRPYAETSAEFIQWQRQMKDETLAIAAYLWDRSEHPELQGWKDDGKSPAPAPKAALRAQVEKDYSEDALKSAGADDTGKEGEKLFNTAGCRGCHAVGAEEADAWKARERDIAPNLGSVGLKMNVSWLAYWVEDPTRYWHGTRMPKLRLSKSEAGSLAYYLSQQKLAPQSPAEVDDEEVAQIRDESSRKKLVDKGSKLIANYGCFGCHQIGGFESFAPIAPELNGFSHKDVHTIDYGYAVTNHHQKTWETFVVWKLDSPRIYRTDRIELRMADFDLSPREIRALTVFLRGLDEQKVRPDMDPREDAEYKAMMTGRDLVEEYNCRGCHLIEGIGNDIQGAMNRMVDAKLPYGFQQTDDDHSLQFGPPSLTAEGMRVQPEWLYSFLQSPGEHPIRPFLHPDLYLVGKGEKVPDNRLTPRMPTFPFDTQQITSIIKYFASWDGQEFPFMPPKKDDLTKEQKLSALVHLNSNDDGGVKCIQCHYVGTLTKERAEADWKALAPNMGNESQRLRPLWVKTWIGNPPEFLPYTKMAPLWTNGEGKADPYGPPKPWTKPAIKFDSADDQIELFRDFVFTFKPNSALPSVGQEETSPLVTGEVPSDDAQPAGASDKGADKGKPDDTKKDDPKPGDKKPDDKKDPKPG